MATINNNQEFISLQQQKDNPRSKIIQDQLLLSRSLLNHTFFHIREREPLLPSKGIFTDSSIRTWMCHFRGHRPAHLTHRCCVCSQQGDERGPKGTSYTVELYHRRTQKLWKLEFIQDAGHDGPSSPSEMEMQQYLLWNVNKSPRWAGRMFLGFLLP